MSEELFKSIRAATNDECKQMWDFFDENLPGDCLSKVTTWVSEGASLESIYKQIMERAEPLFVKMTDNGRKAFGMMIEYAIRKQHGQI